MQFDPDPDRGRPASVGTGDEAKGKQKGKERLRAVTLLYYLVQPRVSQLFDPSKIEEELVNLIGGSCFKVELPLLLLPLPLHSRCWRTSVFPTSASRTPDPE